MATKWPIKEKAISYRNGLLTKTKQNIKKSKGTEQMNPRNNGYRLKI